MNPIRTLVLTLAMLAAGAAAQTLYFYPPDDPKWIAGRAYISQGDATSAKPLTIDSTKCGWYKVTLSASDPLRSYSQFWLGKPGKDRIGPNGRLSTDYDSVDEFDANAGVFRLGEKFNSLGTNIYFVADELDPTDPNAGWYGYDPTLQDASLVDEGRCKFELAAFIYDTDISVHPDFSCGEYSMGQSAGNGPDTKPNCTLGTWTGEGYSATVSSADAYTKGGNLKGTCTGVRPGVVQKELGDDRKIKYNASGDQWKCWTDESWFNKAFTSTPGVNVEHCYNMPFTQVKSGASAGSFEFDSDKLRNANGYIVGGFFPELLHNAPADASCPNCNAKRPAECFAPLIKQISTQVFDNYTPKTGEFDNGNNPVRGTVLPGVSGTATEGVWNWANPNEAPDGTEAGTRQGMKWYMHGTTPISGKNMAPANLFFCFESHADFYYDPSQVFYFRGDDDIWIYINKKLAIDLGGTHLAAPGKIDLGAKAAELGLVEGELYPIDIFFCDRRSTMSNVRISTNMYIAQKSNFYNDLAKTENPMCVIYQGGADCASRMSGNNATGQNDWCGYALIENGFKVDFYMVRRGTTDTTWLSGAKNTKDCNGNDETFTCFGGITVDKAIYRCGGRGQCKGNAEATAKVDIQGNFNVYARLMGADGKQVAGSKPLLIDNFKSETNLRLIWGNVEGEIPGQGPKGALPNAYGEPTSQNQQIIAGKRTPIYIASGSWSDPGTFTAFVYDNDPDFVTGKGYAVSVSGGSGLRIYRTPTGGDPVTSGTLPATGIDTLWVEGDYTGGNKQFELNVVAKSESAPSMTLTVYQPTIQFMEKDFVTKVTNPDGYTPRWTPDSKPPYVGSGLDVYIAAWDPIKNEICGHCSFTLRDESTINGKSYNLLADNLKIENGRLSTYIHGLEETGDAQFLVTWKIFTSSAGSQETTQAQWTGLRFRNAPIPVPIASMIFDRNGDGIGDSVVIAYNKPLNLDSLPVLLEVVWGDSSNIKSFHVDGYNPADLRNPGYVKNLYRESAFMAANRAYWQQLIKRDSLISISGPTTAFSSDILTATPSGKSSSISSWIPFVEQDACVGGVCPETAFQYSSVPTALSDRISPIVVKAEYEAGRDGQEVLRVRFSEPVFAASGTEKFDFKNPFNYYLGNSQGGGKKTISPEEMISQTYDNLDWGWERGDTASSAIYKPGNKQEPADALNNGNKGFDNVDMIYYSYRTETAKSRTPQPGDWVKIIPNISVLTDGSDNPSNPRERGVLITGTKPSNVEQIRIGEIEAKDPKGPSIGGIFEPGGILPPWINNPNDLVTNEIMQGGSNPLFKEGNVAEFLPVPEDMHDIREIQSWYPGSVGSLFQVDISNQVNNFFDTECVGCTVEGGDYAKAIIIHASAYYHTNLGDYTAHRPSVDVSCASNLFNGDCISSRNQFYLAWNLKTNNNRFVGAGAYVVVGKFYWQLNYKKPDGSAGYKRFDEKEFIEMFGVRRR